MAKVAVVEIIKAHRYIYHDVSVLVRFYSDNESSSKGAYSVSTVQYSKLKLNNV